MPSDSRRTAAPYTSRSAPHETGRRAEVGGHSALPELVQQLALSRTVPLWLGGKAVVLDHDMYFQIEDFGLRAMSWRPARRHGYSRALMARDTRIVYPVSGLLDFQGEEDV